MNVLVADLNEDATGLGKKFATKQKAIAEIGEVRVNPQLPRIPKRLDHFGLLRQVRIAAVLHVALADEGLEVAAVLDAVGRVDVDHLHLPGQALLDQQAVAGDQPVGPALVVAVEVHRAAQRQVLERRFEEAGLAAQG